MRIMQRYLLTLSAFKYFASVNGLINLSDTCTLLFLLHKKKIPASTDYRFSQWKQGPFLIFASI